MLEKMILEGAVEFAGIDSETGEMLYSFSDKMKDLYPAMFNDAQNFFNQLIYNLWEQGFVSMDITEENPMVRITEKALNEEAVAGLKPELSNALRYLMSVMRNKD